ncbi:MAG: hypothetical protein ACJAUP_001719 [Cellvibrionaceae bacterium]|jgi:hypothetical protein
MTLIYDVAIYMVDSELAGVGGDVNSMPGHRGGPVNVSH